jgi:hypothetical protein
MTSRIRPDDALGEARKRSAAKYSEDNPAKVRKRAGREG